LRFLCFKYRFCFIKRRAFLSYLASSLAAEVGTCRLNAEVLTSKDPNNYKTFDQDILKAIDECVHSFMQRRMVPGVSVAFTKDEALVFEKAFGFADVLKLEPLTSQHRFRIASVSKPLTSIAVFKLVDAGKLRLSDNVFGVKGILSHRFSSLRTDSFLDLISIDDLLTHSVGNWGNDQFDPIDLSLPIDVLILSVLEKRRLDKPPGQKFCYSNFGYCLLGRVIEVITKQPYSDSLQNILFSPLGASSFDLSASSIKDKKEKEVFYFHQVEGSPYRYNMAAMDSCGGWISTPRDLAKLLVHVDGFSSKKDILPLDLIQRMTTPYLDGYARGWFVNRSNNWWHNGRLNGSLSFVHRGSDGTNIVIFCNTSGDQDLINSFELFVRDLSLLFSNIKSWPLIDLFSVS
jgi:CubicO group peptidase (beta-lactamase class C family)